MHLFVRACIAWGLLFVGTASASDQIVLRFREHAQVSGNIVRLHHLVEVVHGQSDSLEKLLQVAVGPAPPNNRPQTWEARAILQHLELRGVASERVRWSGNETMQLVRATGLPGDLQNSMAPAFVEPRLVKQAETLIGQAIRDAVNYQTGEQIDWQVKVQLPAKSIRALQTKRSIVAIGGGKAPWEGKQQFAVQVRHMGQDQTFTVDAVLELPPMVVAAARPMRRDEVITASALTFKPLSAKESRSNKQFFTTFDEVVGKQLRRSMSTGLAIESEYVGEPILIQRNSLISLESISGPIVVSTQARSLGSGAQGELIEVEMLPNRQRVFATVVDSLTVRIAGRPAR